MPTNARPNSTPSAFTLVEILVVVIILAIAAAIVVPSMSGTASMQATAAARMISADLQYAQNMAITYQELVFVDFTTSGEYYELSNASGPLIHPMTKSDYTVNFATQGNFGRLDVVSADFAGNPRVTFDEIGAPDNPGSVTVAAGGISYSIAVAPATGRVTVTYIGS